MHPDAWLRRDEIANFSAAPAIRLNGGAYKWADNGDGTKTILDMPLVATFAKGTKGIQYEGDEQTLTEIAAYHKGRHDVGHFLPTAFKGHNDPLQKAEMSGFVFPTRVGKAMTQHGEKAALFGNLKVFDAQFDEIRAGRLPYVSPEIHKTTKKITGLALLNTEPPHNEFPMLIPGDQVKDDTAKFDAKEDPEEKDMNAEEIKKLIADILKDGLAKFSADQADLAKKVDDLAKKSSVPAPDPTKGKPSAMPAQPNDPLPGEPAKMSSDPEMAAKFSALTAENAEIKARLDKQDSEKKAGVFMAKVERALGRKIVPQTLKDQIATFAADWAGAKDGEATLDRYVEALKPALKDKPTVGFEPSAGADVTDPVIAKFAKEGADLSEVATFGAQYDELARAMPSYKETVGKEAYIKNEIIQAAAKRNGTLETTRR